jgi:hypothetical protein
MARLGVDFGLYRSCRGVTCSVFIFVMMTENSPLSFRLHDPVSIQGGRHDGLLGTIVSGLKGTVEAENLINGFYHYHVQLDGGLGFVLMAPRYLSHLPEDQQVDVATGVALTVIRGEMQFSDASTEDAGGVSETNSDASVEDAVEEGVEESGLLSVTLILWLSTLLLPFMLLSLLRGTRILWILSGSSIWLLWEFPIFLMSSLPLSRTSWIAFALACWTIASVATLSVAIR